MYMISIWQHGKDEAPGEVADYFTRIREPFEIQRLYESQTIPRALPEYLIILGGQMSVNDSRKYPYFIEEKRKIREMIKEVRPVLGICLGAQMIAASLGKQVYPSPSELGWTRIKGCITPWKELFPEQFTAFQWHNETFNLPAGATSLATGSVVSNQAFRIGSAIGVQFHPEVTLPIISRWSENLPQGDREEIIHGAELFLRQSRQRCHDILKMFMRGWI